MSDSKKLSTEPYKGTRDFYPDDWARLNTLFSKIRQTIMRFGYEEYNASPLERAEIYENKTSEEIVSSQTYTFTDRGDRKVTLRPEMTPTLARMVSAKRRELPFPLRWFSIGNRFRYERPQRGRLREFYQVDVDLLGVASMEADIEIITLATTILKDLGASENDFTIRISSRSLLNTACSVAGLAEKDARAYTRLLDRKAKMHSEDFAKEVKKLTEKDPLSLIMEGTDADVAREKRELLKLIETLGARGIINARFDPSITRGFDYYTGMVFEVYDTNPANTRSLFGGGRYDKLITLFGGDPIPAVGFGMGDVTLTDFIETHQLPLTTDIKPQLYIGTPDATNIPGAEAFAETLRAQGGRVFVNLTEKPLGDQIKDAVRREIPLFLAYGENEVREDLVRLKVLATGEEIGMASNAVSTYLKTLG
ncbi:MAG TPA: histidine--tRNA ligase [Candidatus Kaiserbacteria bacterium]|nr:histidine--tRNA ligase [Candidatus Kaiserbacteria bacterium]